MVKNICPKRRGDHMNRFDLRGGHMDRFDLIEVTTWTGLT
jgi:hypothetical protein